MGWLKKLGKKIKKSLHKASKRYTNHHSWSRAVHKAARSVRNRTKRERNVKALKRLAHAKTLDLGLSSSVGLSSGDLANANAYQHSAKTLAQMTGG